MLLALPFLAPLFLQPLDLHRVEGAQALGSAFGKAVRGAVAEHEHQQPVVVTGAGADQLAIGIERLDHPVQGAVHRHILDPLDAAIERGLPCDAELFGTGLAAQVVGAGLAHIDRLARRRDRSGVGEGFDKGDLAGVGPAIVAGAEARDGGEGGQLSGGNGGAGGAGVFASGHGKGGSQNRWVGKCGDTRGRGAASLPIQ